MGRADFGADGMPPPARRAGKLLSPRLGRSAARRADAAQQPDGTKKAQAFAWAFLPIEHTARVRERFPPPLLPA